MLATDLHRGREGLVHPVGDIEALTACVSMVLDSELLRTALVKRAWEHLRQRFARRLESVAAVLPKPRRNTMSPARSILRPTG